MKAVLFDFGGTIDTDGVHWSEKFWEYYERTGLAGITKGAFEKAFVRSEEDLVRDPLLPEADFLSTLRKQFALQCASLGLAPSVAESMAEACYRDVQATIAGARPLLADLARHYGLGLVSNFYGNLEVVCREFGIRGLFTAVVDSARVGVRKPDPAIFREALVRLGRDAAETWVVGDSYERDIVPAKLIGCKTIWLKGRSWKTPPAADSADRTVSHLAEIRSILLQ